MATLPARDYWTAAADAFAPDALELTLLPTEQCNLRCTYCYETFAVGRMDDWVVTAVKELMTRRQPELRRLVIDWFGGEPLLAMDVIEDISGLAEEFARSNPLLDYQSSITTNGVLLTADYARRLSTVGVTHLHVSLDGPGATHDLTRRLRGGRGTYERIEANLREILDSDVDAHIDLRVHVTPANVDLLDDFTTHLIDTFLGDDRFSAYFFPIVDLGGPNQGAFRVLHPSEANAVMRRLTARVAAVQKRKAKKGKGCDSAYVCYAAKPNAWVVRADGRLAKCTVGFEDDRNNVGRLLPDGSLEVRADAVRPWLRGWSDGDILNLHCPYEEMRDDVQSGLVTSRR
ncbi:radical SAM protein [Mycobacterium sp.]|uniref:radical SAM protein n=1 Tax=Mycobacterium sp. TaxID=1785 RepID=UPI002C81EE00|nr:radical SAM protein [Mycobacterium sp.]HKP42077.1 radical SAM protein [Mycobacterium sp.]